MIATRNRHSRDVARSGMGRGNGVRARVGAHLFCFILHFVAMFDGHNSVSGPSAEAADSQSGRPYELYASQLLRARLRV